MLVEFAVRRQLRSIRRVVQVPVHHRKPGAIVVPPSLSIGKREGGGQQEVTLGSHAMARGVDTRRNLHHRADTGVGMVAIP